MKNIKYLTILFIGILIINACDKNEDPPVVIDETPYLLEYGALPAPDLPADNPLTVQGVELGRMLFYETLLSKDGTLTCHDIP